MKKHFRSLALAALLSGSLAAPVARAEANDGLSATQRAYADVDYDRTRRLAKEALEQGGNDRATTGELYLMWGLAAAALDEGEEARSAFLYALAINPELKLDRSLSPKMRGPYLEARGQVATADGKSPLEVSITRGARTLEIELRDKLRVVASLDLFVRSSDGSSFTRQSFPGASQQVPIAGRSQVDAYVQVLDRHGNVLGESGSATAPQHFSFVSSKRPSANQASSSSRDVNRTPYLLTAGALAVLGAAAGGVATAMYIRREDAAREWNGPGCEHPGLTRAQQCAQVDVRRQGAETLSIGLGGAAAAFLIGSAVTWWLAPSSSREAQVAIDAAPGNVVLRLRGTL